MTKRYAVRAAIILFITLFTALVFAPAVLAHATIVRSDPADNAVLDAPPRDIHLWFSQPLVLEFSKVRMLDISGHEVKIGAVKIDPADRGALIISLPDGAPLGNGVYSVAWKVLSTDGHYTPGYIVFGVGKGTNLSAAAAVQNEASVPPLEVALRWISYGLLALLTGAWIVARFVLQPVASPDLLQAARKRVLRLAVWSTGLLIVSNIAWLGYQLSVLMAGEPEGAPFVPVLWQLVTETQWGAVWIARQVILIVLLVLVVLDERTRVDNRAGLSGFLIAALTVAQALAGHAAATTRDVALAVAADTLHLIAIGLWIGGVFALVVGLWPLLRRRFTASSETASSEVAPNETASISSALRAAWGPFGRVAALGVALIVITGLYNTARQVASIDALITTLYGRVLLIKVGLMLAAGAVGLTNSMLLHPAVAAPFARLLNRPPGWTPLTVKRLPALVLAEAGVGLLIFLATSIVTAAPQARGPEFAPPPVSTSPSQIVNDMLITFSAKPNLPGENLITIEAVSSRRPEPAPVLRVIVQFTYLEKDIGRLSIDADKIEPGRYQLGGNYFSLAGQWQVDVVVRRKGLEDTAATFNWTVPAAQSRPVVISNQPLEPALTVIAFLLAVSLAVLLALRLRRRTVRHAGVALPAKPR